MFVAPHLDALLVALHLDAMFLALHLDTWLSAVRVDRGPGRRMGVFINFGACWRWAIFGVQLSSCPIMFFALLDALFTAPHLDALFVAALRAQIP